jgi:hypothetical protein
MLTLFFANTRLYLLTSDWVYLWQLLALSVDLSVLIIPLQVILVPSVDLSIGKTLATPGGI